MPAVKHFMLLAVALLSAAAGPARAQGIIPVQRNWGGLYLMVTPPSGEFRDHAGVGGGAGMYRVACLNDARAFGIRVELSGTALGGPEYLIRYSAPGVPDANQVVRYSRGIVALSVGPQITLPGRFVRPYVTGQIGLSYVFTMSERRWEGEDPDFDPLSWDFGPSEFNFPVSAGGGVLIQLSRGADAVWLDLSAQWTRHGRATFVSDASIVESPQGITVRPTASMMSLWQFRAGIVVAN